MGEGRRGIVPLEGDGGAAAVARKRVAAREKGREREREREREKWSVHAKTRHLAGNPQGSTAPHHTAPTVRARSRGGNRERGVERWTWVPERGRGERGVRSWEWDWGGGEMDSGGRREVWKREGDEGRRKVRKKTETERELCTLWPRVKQVSKCAIHPLKQSALRRALASFTN